MVNVTIYGWWSGYGVCFFWCVGSKELLACSRRPVGFLVVDVVIGGVASSSRTYEQMLSALSSDS